jgi:hypothetical protein
LPFFESLGGSLLFYISRGLNNLTIDEKELSQKEYGIDVRSLEELPKVVENLSQDRPQKLGQSGFLIEREATWNR